MAKTVTRKFRMHEQLLFDVIKRQAGTLAKSTLEGVMNSVDAGATRCEIALNNDTLIIADDGGGFPNRRAIEKYFETFGQPHEEKENKVYANFRMGRGQLFAFGQNLWESGKFRMDVDIRNNGLDYELTTNADPVEGCTVTVYLYNKLLPSAVHEIRDEIAEYCEWIPIPVFFNDERISKDATETKWDYESDTAYVRLDASRRLKIYNLGAFVSELPAAKYGRGGIVVSKEQLKLNFARNQVLVNECKIWKEVEAFVRKNADTEIKRKPRLNEYERELLAMRIKRRELQGDEARKCKVFTDIGGRHYSLNQLEHQAAKLPGYTAECLSRRGRNAQRMDMVHQMKLSFVFSASTLIRFDCETVEELFEIIRDHSRTYGRLRQWPHIPADKCLESLNTTYELITDEKELTPDERVWLKLLDRFGDMRPREDRYPGTDGEATPVRRFYVGRAEHADGWTDGLSYIAISRDFIKRQRPNCLASIVAMGQLVLHEWCHDGPDTDTHQHTTEFYQQYHDSSDLLGLFVERCVHSLEWAAQSVGKKLTRQSLRAVDATVKMTAAADTLATSVREVDGN